MPSMLLVRMAGAVPDVPPRWLLAAAGAICGPGGATPDAATGPFSVGVPTTGAGRDVNGRARAGLAGSRFADGAAGDARPARDRAAPKPTAGAPVGEAVTSWRLGWLDDDATPPAWPPGAVHFGSRSFPVVGADLHRSSYAELAQGRPVRHARLTMNTPTYFCRDGHDLPLPDPALALRGLVARWNRYAPGHLRIGAGEARTLVDAVYLDAMWGSSAEVELGHGLRQVGFVGQADLRLVAAASDYTATMFTALALFAAFAGVGEHTTAGFGAVDVDVDLAGLTCQPRRPAAVPASRAPEARTATR